MRSKSDRCLREFAFNLANQNCAAVRSRFFRPIPAAFQTKPKRFVLGLAENVVLFKLTFPIREPLTPPPSPSRMAACCQDDYPPGSSAAQIRILLLSHLRH